MASSYKEELAWLFGTQLFGIKLGLENVQRLLQSLDLPARDQRIIHVAGTNGKGSVCAMLDAICRAAGYRTGLFTSPHLVTFRERIQVDGVMISEADVACGLATIRELVSDWKPHPTFFEITTALALNHFRATHCEIVVLETGMGGRLDATNAVEPVVSVLTPIALDHQKWLGDTLTEIAGEKAGVIKLHVPVVSASQQSDAEAVIRSKAREVEAPLEFVPTTARTSTNLAGAHQEQNAALAVAALRAARIKLDEDAITRGLECVTWPARFQSWNDRIIIDGAHNPAGTRVLVNTWREQFGEEPAVILLAVLQDKELEPMVRLLAEIACRFVLPIARSERAVPPDQIAAIIRASAPARPISGGISVAAALRQVEGSTQRVLVTGSLHFAGEALAILRGEAEQLEDCLQ